MGDPVTIRLRALDLFCRNGGTGMGLHRAGFDVTGVDKLDCSDQYPFEFVQGDAIEYAKENGHKYALILAGPPCQNQIPITQANRKREGWTDDHENLIPPTRAALDAVGVPYAIENPPSEHIRADVTLCGLTFGLATFRHRAFEIGGWPVPVAPVLPSHRGHLTVGYRHGCLRTLEPSVCPKHGRWCRGTVFGVYGQGGGKPTVPQAQEALGIDWMNDIDDLNEAIPPAFSQWLGWKFRGVS
jgi:hypothetical protein